MKKVLILLFLIVLGLKGSYAQFKVEAQIRPLAEFRRGYDRMPFPDEKAAGFVAQRTRLNFDYKNNRFSTFISFQDVRIWGEEEQKDDVPSITLHEGWVEFAAHDYLFFRMGRQMIQYDRRHIFGWNNWNDNQQKHDFLMIQLRNEEQYIHLATAFNQENQSRLFGTDYPIDNYKFMQLFIAYTPFDQI
jgi:hypothetical protein